jgi:hypothetical protein
VLKHADRGREYGAPIDALRCPEADLP